MADDVLAEFPAFAIEMALTPQLARAIPPSLLKAAQDPFTYALRLRTGEVLTFERATIYGEYATLWGSEPCGGGEYGFSREQLRYPCPRGLDVRIADIVWCADAPLGS